jgi:hypothetical protein
MKERLFGEEDAQSINVVLYSRSKQWSCPQMVIAIDMERLVSDMRLMSKE